MEQIYMTVKQANDRSLVVIDPNTFQPRYEVLVTLDIDQLVPVSEDDEYCLELGKLFVMQLKALMPKY